MALRSWILLFPAGCCAATPSAAPLLFQFIPRVDEQQQHGRPARSSVQQVRSDFGSTPDSSPRAQQSWRDEAEQAPMFGDQGGGGVHGVDEGRFRFEQTRSAEGCFAKQQQQQSSRPGAQLHAGGNAAGVRGSRGGTQERRQRSYQRQEREVSERSGLKGGITAGASRGRGEGARWSGSSGFRTCGEPGATGGVGGARRRRSWAYPRTQQHRLHRQWSAKFAGCVGSGQGRRCTAVFMSAPKSAGGDVEWSDPGTEPAAGGVAEGGGRRRLGENKAPSGEINGDGAAFATMPVEEQALPPLPGAAAAATEQRTGRVAALQDRRAATGSHAAATAASPQEDDARSGINGFELEATAGGGEFADAEAMGPVAESYERGRWLLGLLVLQSTSSFVLDKYQDLLRQHVVVTLFLTMLVGAGGNAGNQSAIKVIRGLATGRFTADAPCALRVIGDQAVVGLLLGTALAAGGFVRVWVTEGTTLRDASAISMSLFLIVMVSVLLGSGLPFGFARAGVDPAHAGTTIQVAMDIVGVAVTCVTCSFVLTQLEQALPLPL